MKKNIFEIIMCRQNDMKEDRRLRKQLRAASSHDKDQRKNVTYIYIGKERDDKRKKKRNKNFSCSKSEHQNSC